MALFANPEGMVTNVPDDILTTAKFAVESVNEDQNTKYVFEHVACYWPKTSGHRFYMVIQVSDRNDTDVFSVVVHENANTLQKKVEQFRSVFEVNI